MDEDYVELVNKIDEVLDGVDIEQIVPALTTFLAKAGYMSGMDKKNFVAFVVDSIDRMYERAGKKNK